jgi:hypothetical protein
MQMARHNQYPKGFRVEHIPAVSEKARQELREKARALGRLGVRPSTGLNGKRGSGSPSAGSNNRKNNR